MFNAPTNTATFKVEAHVDDVKPATAFLAEFELVDLSSVHLPSDHDPNWGGWAHHKSNWLWIQEANNKKWTWILMLLPPELLCSHQPSVLTDYPPWPSPSFCMTNFNGCSSVCIRPHCLSVDTTDSNTLTLLVTGFLTNKNWGYPKNLLFFFEQFPISIYNIFAHNEFLSQYNHPFHRKIKVKIFKFPETPRTISRSGDDRDCSIIIHWKQGFFSKCMSDNYPIT